MEDAVISRQEDGRARLVLTNCSGCTRTVPQGTHLGYAMVAEVIESELDMGAMLDQENVEGSVDAELASVRRVTSQTAEERGWSTLIYLLWRGNCSETF